MLYQCLDTPGPYPNPMRQLSRKNPTRYNVLLLVPTILILLTSYERDPCAVSVVTYLGFISLVQLPFSERPPVLVRSSTTLRKFVQLVNSEEGFLKTSMAFSTMEACEYVRQIDRIGKIADSPNH